MTLDQLKHFVAVVEHGSLRAAARRLEVGQPTLTRSIRLLEKTLGADLFVRTVSGMTPTAAGRQFQRRASVVVNELQRAADEVRQNAGDQKGSVVAALSIMPHFALLPGALPVFRRRWPHVRLEIVEGPLPDVERRLRDGLIDLYIGIAPRDVLAPGLTVQQLFSNPRAVFCRKGHPLANARSLKTLANSQWAGTPVDYDANEDLASLFRRNALSAPEVIVRVRTVASILTVVAHSDLLAMLPIQCDASSMGADRLHLIRVREEIPPTPIVLIHGSDTPLTPAAEYFCDVLLREGPNVEHGRPKRRGSRY